MEKSRYKQENVIAYVFLILLTVITLFPFYWLLTSAFKTTEEIVSRDISWFPKKLMWSNFTTGWSAIPPNTYTRFFANTFKIVILTMIGQTFSSLLVGFGFARLRFKGRDLLFFIMLSTMMLPHEIRMIPIYLIWTKLDLVGTYIPLILPFWFGSAFYIFLFRQFISGIPYSLDEAAICDGASKFKVLCSIIAPLCKPIIFTVMVFSFTHSYEDFMEQLIYISKPAQYTVAIALRMLIENEGIVQWGPILAMSLVSMLPLVVVFSAAQRYLVKGITMTGLK